MRPVRTRWRGWRALERGRGAESDPRLTACGLWARVGGGGEGELVGPPAASVAVLDGAAQVRLGEFDLGGEAVASGAEGGEFLLDLCVGPAVGLGAGALGEAWGPVFEAAVAGDGSPEGE